MGSRITYEERLVGTTTVCEMYYAYDNTGKLYGFYYYGSGPDSFYFYKRNVQGDIIGILDNSGIEVVTYTYDTWGKPEDISGTYASTIGQNNPFRYRDYYYDDETGLYYLNQRYYNPEWRRFINADDFIGQTGALLSHNLFAYCQNNPVMLYDPSGCVPKFNIQVTDGGGRTRSILDVFLSLFMGTNITGLEPGWNYDPHNTNTVRFADENGNAVYDIDITGKDDHGIGFPHQHDWDHKNKTKPRGDAKKPTDPLPPGCNYFYTVQAPIPNHTIHNQELSIEGAAVVLGVGVVIIAGAPMFTGPGGGDIMQRCQW